MGFRNTHAQFFSLLRTLLLLFFLNIFLRICYILQIIPSKFLFFLVSNDFACTSEIHWACRVISTYYFWNIGIFLFVSIRDQNWHFCQVFWGAFIWCIFGPFWGVRRVIIIFFISVVFLVNKRQKCLFCYSTKERQRKTSK